MSDLFQSNRKVALEENQEDGRGKVKGWPWGLPPRPRTGRTQLSSGQDTDLAQKSCLAQSPRESCLHAGRHHRGAGSSFPN